MHKSSLGTAAPATFRAYSSCLSPDESNLNRCTSSFRKLAASQFIEIPFESPQPIQHMPAQRMSWRQTGMVEVGGGIARHPNLLHHAPRAHIRGNREGHNLI